jgi:hypothetical protein
MKYPETTATINGTMEFTFTVATIHTITAMDQVMDTSQKYTAI